MSKSYLFFYGIFLWSLPENDGGGGAMAMEGDERVIAYEKKEKKKGKKQMSGRPREWGFLWDVWLWGVG